MGVEDGEGGWFVYVVCTYYSLLDLFNVWDNLELK